jgi:hypothetical protein
MYRFYLQKKRASQTSKRQTEIWTLYVCWKCGKCGKLRLVRFLLGIAFTLKMEAIRVSETSIDVCRTSLLYSPGALIF